MISRKCITRGIFLLCCKSNPTSWAEVLFEVLKLVQLCEGCAERAERAQLPEMTRRRAQKDFRLHHSPRSCLPSNPKLSVQPHPSASRAPLHLAFLPAALPSKQKLFLAACSINLPVGPALSGVNPGEGGGELGPRIRREPGLTGASRSISPGAGGRIDHTRPGLPPRGWGSARSGRPLGVDPEV